MDRPTIEQMLYELPPAVYDEMVDTNYFLHLQPWGNRHGWNAFYGCVTHNGWIIHPFLRADGDNAVDALVKLNGLVEMTKWSLEADANGEVEEATWKPKAMGEEASD